MNRRITVAFLLLSGAMLAFEGKRDRSSLQASAQEKPSLTRKSTATLDCSFVSPLDELIQERFTQRDRGFGLERVVRFPLKGWHTPASSSESYSPLKTIGLFIPESDQEKEAVEEIERSGLKMSLYVASLRILMNESEESEELRPAFHAPLRGPVAITNGSQKAEWPEKSSLRKHARKAMNDFGSDKSASQYEFSAEGIDFIARPVRAQESCLQCHVPQAYMISGHDLNIESSIRRLSVGDPIGVLLYAYTTSAKSNNVKIP